MRIGSMRMSSMRNGGRFGFDGIVSMAAFGICVTALLVLAHASARASEIDERHWPPRECREIGRVCLHEARTDQRVCRDGCEAGEVGGACREECRSAFQDSRATCRGDVWECVELHLPPLDEACVAECRADFAETREDLRACHGGCKEDVRAAITGCREDLASDPDALRACIRAAREEGRLCAQDCHDEYACGSDFRECLSDCVIEE